MKKLQERNGEMGKQNMFFQEKANVWKSSISYRQGELICYHCIANCLLLLKQ